MGILNESDSTKFFAHHVGGRAGSVAFLDLPKITRFDSFLLKNDFHIAVKRIHERKQRRL